MCRMRGDEPTLDLFRNMQSTEKSRQQDRKASICRTPHIHHPMLSCMLRLLDPTGWGLAVYGNWKTMNVRKEDHYPTNSD